MRGEDAGCMVTIESQGKTGKTMATVENQTPASKSGNGDLKHAVGSFAKAATTWPSAPPPDTDVSAAFAMGWHVADAGRWARCRSTAHIGDVPGITYPTDRWSILIGQIAAAGQRLRKRLRAAGPGRDLSHEVTLWNGLDPSATESSFQAPADPQDVYRLDRCLAKTLRAAEASLGKAYVLGRDLEELCTAPTTPGGAAKKSIQDKAIDVHARLLDLASLLPPNSAHSVDNSLRLWRAAVEVDTVAASSNAASALLAQGRRWREVLAGEVAASDLLRLADYVGAVGGVARRLRDVAWHALRTFAFWLALVLALAAGGVWILLGTETSGSIEAGVASIIAAFGLTWKGIGEFFGRAAAKGEQHLWDAELDWVIAYRCTALPETPGRFRIRNVADRRTRQHLGRYRTWARRWPDIERWMPPPPAKPPEPEPRRS